MKPKIYIRADGGFNIGLGHLVRCIALAQMLKEYFQINFVYKEVPPAIYEELVSLNFINTEISDDKQLLDIPLNNCIVILDGYQFPDIYQQEIKRTGARLIVIDDLHTGHYYADLVINQAPGVTMSQYNAEQYTKFALGPEYVLLRPAFLNGITQKKTIKNHKLLICFGGADSQNLTERALKEAKKFKELKEITVVTGAYYSYLEELKEIVSSDSRIKHLHDVNEILMAQVMSSVDIVLVPSSGILLEALALQKTVISGWYVANQKDVYRKYLSLNAFYDAEKFDSENIFYAINGALKSSPDEKHPIIDQLSGKRILSLFLDMSLNIRKAIPTDINILFDWTNDLEVRNNSLSCEPVYWENHVSWYNTKLRSAQVKFFLLTILEIPVGQIRYDYIDDYWLLNYSIAKEWRGKGLGKKIVEKTICLMPPGSTIRAQVKTDNLSSLSVFGSLNFHHNELLDKGVKNLINFEIKL